MKKTITALLVCFSAVCPVLTAAEDASEAERSIHLKMDDAQVRFGSRIYELEHVTAESILPFVNSAILRYNRNSTIRRVTSSTSGAKEAIMVSTGKDFLPYVDEIVKALDRPGSEGKGTAIEGTGLARVAYAPKYRAANQFSEIIDTVISTSAGKAYVNGETNTIFWRDQTDAAKKTLSWMEKLDRPIPQAALRLNYYELRDSDLKDWGFDYLAWKNGPGVNMLNLGYNAGHMAIDQVIESVMNTAQYTAASSWAYGGFFTAPQFDMSFIRCLQQSGNASVAASATLSLLNTPVRTREEYLRLRLEQIRDQAVSPYIYKISMYPEYQNISKNFLGRTLAGKSYYEDEDGVKHADPPILHAVIINPFICLPGRDGDRADQGFIPDSAEPTGDLSKDGGILFSYSMNFKNVVERGNTGAELSNSVVCNGATTLAFGGEKILAVYEKENDVEMTLGLPILCRIPYIKYIFSTVTSIKERTYIVITAEAEQIHPDRGITEPTSVTTGVKRRIENPFRSEPEEESAPQENVLKENAPQE